MKNKKIIIFIFIFLSSFIVFKFDLIKKLKPRYDVIAWSLGNNQYGYLINKIFNIKNECNDNFNLTKINYIPDGSTLIIGHAYGGESSSARNNDSTITKSVEDFLLDNYSNIKTVIFTGDVIRKSAIYKYENLYNQFNNKFEIFITPGNHEIENFDMKTFDNFLLTKQPQMPFKLKRQGFIMILDDSNKKPQINKLIALVDNENLNDNLLILRHHYNLARNKKLEKYTNIIELINKVSLEESFREKGLVNIIYGDTTPRRLMCYKHKNINHIWSNISDIKKDKNYVLVLNKNKKFFYELVKE
tara:strand:+ start:3591 stop:4496 length:906 start_codon:yes stop_codon:yes gene_type:complete